MKTLVHYTGIDLVSSAPPSSHRSLLSQSRPNPFWERTSIGLELPAPGHATLRIYDAEGRLVRRLLNEQRTAGLHSVDWDGRDDDGRTVRPGIYWYRLGVGDLTETKRLVLVR